MSARDEILEFPYVGTIIRKVEGRGESEDEDVTIYEGVMDEHLVTDVEGRVMQTAAYIISIPLVKDANDNWCMPHKGDFITLSRYGETLDLVVDNVEPSQLGGVSIYAARKSWD